MKSDGPTLEFTFELGITISADLPCSSGELAELVSDGLFTMDERDLLFPGITRPGWGDRLIGCSLRPLAFAQLGVPERKNTGTRRAAGSAKAGQSAPLREALEGAAYELTKAIVALRMLDLKANGVIDALQAHRAEVDVSEATAFLGAINSVTALVAESVRPLL